MFPQEDIHLLLSSQDTTPESRALRQSRIRSSCFASQTPLSVVKTSLSWYSLEECAERTLYQAVHGLPCLPTSFQWRLPRGNYLGD